MSSCASRKLCEAAILGTSDLLRFVFNVGDIGCPMTFKTQDKGFRIYGLNTWKSDIRLRSRNF